MTPSEPLDQLHADCLEARYETRRDFTAARLRASRWTPKPEDTGRGKPYDPDEQDRSNDVWA
jgi:hypothetical protein